MIAEEIKTEKDAGMKEEIKQRLRKTIQKCLFIYFITVMMRTYFL